MNSGDDATLTVLNRPLIGPSWIYSMWYYEHMVHIRGLPPGLNEVLAARTTMHDEQAHSRLQTNMIKEIWSRNNG